MNDFLKNSSDRMILLKSAAIVLVVGVLLFAGLRHAVPSAGDDSSYGGGVLLLLPRSQQGEREFRRWAELNRPSNVFGYNSIGLFSALIPVTAREKVPFFASPRALAADFPAPVMPRDTAVSLRKEPVASRNEVAILAAAPGVSREARKGLPVYGDSGEVKFFLPEIRSTAENVLLIRAEKAPGGTAFRIVGSSGDGRFDETVRENLEARAGEETVPAGLLAVWPDGKGKEAGK